jgi:hypothetical protein
MNRRTALLIFLAVCIVLAILLLTTIIKPLLAGIIFAIALVVLGGLSGGFRRH